MISHLPYTKINQQEHTPARQLTVVTVCWNALAELKPTVESVLRQKAKGSISIEHVVVDGASTDGTPEWLAEQLAAGNIERYVSEPDRGIYDAMNKGINLARGRVLAFLNAGDTYADEDLAACALPICRGETQTVAACARLINSPFGDAHRPDYNQLFLNMPCHHQAFFAATDLYRKMGGYDMQLRCAADADMVYRMYRATGRPLILDMFAANFPADGFSSDAGDRFRDELVELLWRNWDLVMEKQGGDRDFKVILEAQLAFHCREFRNWQERHGKYIPDTLKALRQMCADLAGHAHSLFAKTALHFMAHCYLPPMIKGRPCPAFTAKLQKFFMHACYVPGDNVYKGVVWLPNAPLPSNPLLLFRSKPRH